MPAPRWKEPQRALAKAAKGRQTRAADKQARQAIRVRDRFTCRLCGRKTSTVHEHQRRGAGGPVSAANSFLLCSVPDEGFCHDLVQTRWVYPVMADGSEAFDASQPLVFEMSSSTATRIFQLRGPVPAHVRIVEGIR